MQNEIWIGQNRYVIPEEITVSQFELIQAFGGDKRAVVQVGLRCTRMDLDEMDDFTFHLVYELCERALGSVKESEAIGIDYDSWTFGQWIDADVIVHKDPLQKLGAITSLLFGEDTSEWPIQRVWATFIEYMNWRANVYNQYKNLFGTGKSTEDADDEVKQAEIERVWWLAILKLIDGRFVDIDEATDRPFRQALNFLAWKKEEDEKLERQLREQSRKLQIN